jgi:DNA-binding CsgD family transcriptional regulator
VPARSGRLGRRIVDSVVAAVPAGVERVIRACSDEHDDRALRLAVLDEIRQVVGFDAYAWLVTDPETEVGAAPLADVPRPLVHELPRLVRLKYLTPVNRWTRLDVPVGLLRVATSGQRERSLLWRSLLRRYDVGDVASLVFRDRFGCWGFLDLWRLGSDAAFADQEAERLASIVGPVTAALRRCQRRSFALPGTDRDRSGPVVLVLSPELDVRAQTQGTEEYLRLLVPPDGDRRPIPAGAYNVAAQLLAVEAGVDDHPPSARVHLGDGTWRTLRAARIGDSTPVADRDIAVTIEHTSPAARMSLFVRAHGLSDREAELLAHLSTGADTRQIAQRMFLSQNTVQDHLKSIFAKTGAPNRRALLAQAVGH